MSNSRRIASPPHFAKPLYPDVIIEETSPGGSSPLLSQIGPPLPKRKLKHAVQLSRNRIQTELKSKYVPGCVNGFHDTQVVMKISNRVAETKNCAVPSNITSSHYPSRYTKEIEPRELDQGSNAHEDPDEKESERIAESKNRKIEETDSLRQCKIIFGKNNKEYNIEKGILMRPKKACGRNRESLKTGDNIVSGYDKARKHYQPFFFKTSMTPSIGEQIVYTINETTKSADSKYCYENKAFADINLSENIACEAKTELPELAVGELGSRFLMRSPDGFFRVGDEHLKASLRRITPEPPGSKTTGVQATAAAPFRLLFWPNEDWTDTNSVLLRALRLALCQCGLAAIVLSWALAGAMVFHLTEAPREYARKMELSKEQTELVVGLATDLRLIVPKDAAWRNTIEHYAAHHERLILSAVSSGYPQRGTIWTYPGCLLFATSLLTTLGFGAPVPRTVAGRVSAILFAGLGIPMHLLLVLNVGLLLAAKLQNCAAACHAKAAACHAKAARLQRTFARVRKHHTAADKSSKDAVGTWPDQPFGEVVPAPGWLRCFPFVAIPLYYLTGLLLFGIARGKAVPDMFLFPLDFTAAGGVAGTDGLLRIAYAIYLECAVLLASINVALVRTSATRGFTKLGIKLGLMTNERK